MWLVILIVALFILFLIVKNFKTLKIGSLSLVSGGVKTGKTTLAVYLATREYRKVLIRWYIRKFFGIKEEKPLLYSNIPLNMDFVLLDQDYLLRNYRFIIKSLIS